MDQHKKRKFDIETKQTTRPDAGFRRRIIALGVLLGLLLFIFLLRLIQFQLVDGNTYRQQAEGTAPASETVLVPSAPPQGGRF